MLFKEYTRKETTAQLSKYVPGESSEADRIARETASQGIDPKTDLGFIARVPHNHDDKYYVDTATAEKLYDLESPKDIEQ